MSKKTLDALVEGGKASPAPPLGPALGPMGVNVVKVIAEINEKTKAFAGMKVPIKLVVDTDTKEFEIEVGTPPVSSLIKKELHLEKGGSDQKNKVGDISLEAAKKIASMKESALLGKTPEARLNEVLGTCVSMGVTVDGGKNPIEIQREHKKSKN